MSWGKGVVRMFGSSGESVRRASINLSVMLEVEC
jgi:hypothetical protein